MSRRRVRALADVRVFFCAEYLWEFIIEMRLWNFTSDFICKYSIFSVNTTRSSTADYGDIAVLKYFPKTYIIRKTVLNMIDARLTFSPWIQCIKVTYKFNKSLFLIFFFFFSFNLFKYKLNQNKTTHIIC